MRTLLFWLTVAGLFSMGTLNMINPDNLKAVDQNFTENQQEGPEEMPITNLPNVLVGTWEYEETIFYMESAQKIKGEVTYYANGAFDRIATYTYYETQYSNDQLERLEKDIIASRSAIHTRGRWHFNEAQTGWIEQTIHCKEVESYKRERIREHLSGCELYSINIPKNYGIYDAEFGKANIITLFEHYLYFRFDDLTSGKPSYTLFKGIDFDSTKFFNPDELEAQIKSAQEEVPRNNSPTDPIEEKSLLEQGRRTDDT